MPDPRTTEQEAFVRGIVQMQDEANALLRNRKPRFRKPVVETVRIDRIDYTPWIVRPSTERTAAYKTTGIRSRLRGETLLVHCCDEDIARDIDAKAEAP